MVSKKDLNLLQLKKLNLAAEILHRTASLYDGSKSTLPLWGAGVITHGIPKIKKCVIGITEEAKSAEKSEITKDHLYRVTETAKYIIKKIVSEKISVSDIEDILLERSSLMITTRTENNKILKKALERCENKDCWKDLYRIAKVKYELYAD